MKKEYRIKNNLFEGIEILLKDGSGFQLPPRPKISNRLLDEDEINNNVQIQNLVRKKLIKLMNNKK